MLFRSRTRPALLRRSLDYRADGDFPNLDRIASAGVNTYGREHLDFMIETVIAGLASAARTPPAAE